MSDPVEVPTVVGLTQQEAQRAVTTAGLTVGTVTKAVSTTIPEGGVISSTPNAGTPVNPGSVVALQVSSGPARVTVPAVVGSTQETAQTALTSAGLTVGTVTKSDSSTTPSGSVISSNPNAGMQVSLGSAVALSVSSGPPAQVAVPRLIGLTQAEAETALNEAGLTVRVVTTAQSSIVPVGSVISANPSAGMRVDHSEKVHLEVSKGPESKWSQRAPSILFGLLTAAVLVILIWSISGKQGLLTDLAQPSVARGLITLLIVFVTVGIALLLVLSTFVLEENAESDKRFDRGKQVLTTMIGVVGTIVGFYFGSVNTPNAGQIAVPAVAGLTETAAENALTSAGLTVGTVTKADSSTIPVGGVISANPNAGTQVNPGSAVNLQISSGPASNSQQQGGTSPLKITPATLPDGTVNAAYQPITLQATGGTPPLKWSVAPALPAGLVLEAAGIIDGTPTAASPKTKYTVTVTDHATPPAVSSIDTTLEIKQ